MILTVLCAGEVMLSTCRVYTWLLQSIHWKWNKGLNTFLKKRDKPSLITTHKNPMHSFFFIICMFYELFESVSHVCTWIIETKGISNQGIAVPAMAAKQDTNFKNTQLNLLNAWFEKIANVLAQIEHNNKQQQQVLRNKQRESITRSSLLQQSLPELVYSRSLRQIHLKGHIPKSTAFWIILIPQLGKRQVTVPNSHKGTLCRSQSHQWLARPAISNSAFEPGLAVVLLLWGK